MLQPCVLQVSANEIAGLLNELPSNFVFVRDAEDGIYIVNEINRLSKTVTRLLLDYGPEAAEMIALSGAVE